MSPRKAERKEDLPLPTRPTIHESSPLHAEKSMLERTAGAEREEDHLNVPERMCTVSSSMYWTGGSLCTASGWISSACRNSFNRPTETLASTSALNLADIQKGGGNTL